MITNTKRRTKVQRTATGKPIVPANIATMSEAEYHEWFRALTQADLDYLECRTFETVEWSVGLVDEYGDMNDVDFFETPAEAEEAYRVACSEADSDLAVVLEERTHTSRVIDFRCLEDTKFETLATHGNQDNLRAGGWID